MSSQVVLRIQPGESMQDFTRRIADTAPSAPPDVMDRLRALLPIHHDAAAPARPRQTARPAA